MRDHVPQSGPLRHLGETARPRPPHVRSPPGRPAAFLITCGRCLGPDKHRRRPSSGHTSALGTSLSLMSGAATSRWLTARYRSGEPFPSCRPGPTRMARPSAHAAQPPSRKHRTPGRGASPEARSHSNAVHGGVSRPVGRVLCTRLRGPAAIHLGLPLPAASCGLPAGIGRAALKRSRRSAGEPADPLDLAPGGVYRATAVTCGAGGLLHHRFTLTPAPSRRRGGLFSVALSRGSPRVGVTDHPALWSPDLPRRTCTDPPRPPGRLTLR
jgi:hypothetical protein